VITLPLVLRTTRVMLVVLLLLLYVVFVWPTRFKYDHVVSDGDTYPVRIDRFNGDADMLTPDDGWYPMGAPDSTDSPGSRTAHAHRGRPRPTI
jgi:hypothetical protein